MARKHRITDTDSDEPFVVAPEPEEPEADVSDSLTPSETITWQYVGPPYNLGIQLHGTRILVRPAHMTQEEIAAFLETHPERSVWFLPAEKL